MAEDKDEGLIEDLRSRLACVVEATYWDRPYEERIAAIRGMGDLTTNGMTPAAVEVFMQWKNVEVCLDFQCTCSDPDDAYDFHLDGFTFGRFRCPRCGTTWRLGTPPVTQETAEETARLSSPAVALEVSR